MEQISEADFRSFPDGALSRANHAPVAIVRSGKRIAVLMPPALFDLYKLYEDVYWDSFGSTPDS